MWWLVVGTIPQIPIRSCIQALPTKSLHMHLLKTYMDRKFIYESHHANINFTCRWLFDLYCAPSWLCKLNSAWMSLINCQYLTVGLTHFYIHHCWFSVTGSWTIIFSGNWCSLHWFKSVLKSIKMLLAIWATLQKPLLLNLKF